MKYFPTSCRIKILLLFLTFVSPIFAQQSAVELKLAEQYSRAGDYESALPLYVKQYNNGNKTVKVINGLDRCLRELNYLDERISFLKEVLDVFPNLYNYKIDLGSSYHINQQFDLAMKTWESVYSFRPADVLRYRRVAQAMTNARLIDEAIDVYKKGLSDLKNQETLNLDIGNLYRVQLDYEKATFHLLSYYRKFKKRGSYVRSQLINMAKDDEAADRIINSLESFNKDEDPDLKEILSNLYIRKKEYNNALKIILEIEESVGNKFIYLNRFAKEAEKDNAFNYVIQAYEYVLNKSASPSIPNIEIKLANAHYQLAVNLFNSGNKKQSDLSIEKSQTLLRNLILKETAQKYQAAELLGDIFKLHFNDLDRALEYYQQINYKRISKDSADRIYFKIADIYILKNELDKAFEQYTLVSTKNYKSKALFEIAEMDYFKGYFNTAKKKYNVLLSQIGMMNNLANNIMDRIFEIDLFVSDSSAFVEYSRANLLKRQNKYSEAAAKFYDIFEIRNITSFYAGKNAAILYSQLDKKAEAQTILKQIIENYQNEEQIDYAYFLLANNYKDQKDLPRALALYEEILFRFPTSLYTELSRKYAREIDAQIKENLN